MTTEAKPAVDEPNNGNVAGDNLEDRSHWSSRWVFWLAAIGSAVGLGNLWRFPWQCATWGGGAFIFAYILCLVTIGMPIMTQELTLGQKHRSGDIEAFGKMNWRLRGVGLASVFGAFVIVTYYMVIIGMSLVLFFDSFKTTLPYGDTNLNYAYDDIWFLAPSIEGTQGVIGGNLFVCTTISWIVTFLCIQKGVKTASWAVKITMPLPILLLLILLINGLTLEGAGQGITSQYLNFSDWSKLADVGLWNAAIGQCFFSLSVCMGVMTAYASYNPPTQNIATDEKIISLSDLFVSLLSGFVVYSVLGHLVATTGDETLYTEASFGLVFIVYPQAITSFKGAHFFGIAFFLTLFLLGIDSAFSMVEAIATVIQDSDFNKYRLNNLSRAKISAVLCFLGAFISALYCWDTGLYWLDIVDRYVNNYGMVFLGICETGACGWFYRTDVQSAVIGKKSVNIYRIGYFVSLFLLVIISFTAALPVRDINGVYTYDGGLGPFSWIAGFVVAIISYSIFLFIAYINRSDKTLDFCTSIWHIAGWSNVEILREYINTISDKDWPSQQRTLAGELRASIHHALIGIWWGFFIKYFIPTILILNLVAVMRNDSYNFYGDYPFRYLLVGIFIFSVMVLAMVIVAIRPQLMTQKDDSDINKDTYVNPNSVSNIELETEPPKYTQNGANGDNPGDNPGENTAAEADNFKD